MMKTLVLFLFVLASCNGISQKKGTPHDYRNNVIVSAAVYSKDSLEILSELYAKMKNHEASFTNPEFFDSTKLLIDSIMYDSSLDKIAVFVVAENPTFRNPHSDSKLPYYYNAYCYLGKRENIDGNNFELECLCRFSEINFNDSKTAAKALSEDLFTELATVLDEKKKPVFEYNLDDKRFWTSLTGWRRIFE